MNFNNFEALFIKENRLLKRYMAFTALGLIGLLMLVLFERRYYLLQGGAVFRERPLAVEVCRLSFESLAQGDAHPFLVSEGIRRLVEKDPFHLVVDDILLLKSLDENRCKVVLKSEGKLLAFEITLQSDDSYPFFYQLAQLDEVGVKEEEL